MRALYPLAVALVALAVAAPAGAIPGGGLAGTLRPSGLAGAAGATQAADKARSCQSASKRTSTHRSGLLGDRRRPAVVACEQPPKSNLVPPDAIAKATAAALSALG
jgi:hypothetical protein